MRNKVIVQRRYVHDVHDNSIIHLQGELVMKTTSIESMLV